MFVTCMHVVVRNFYGSQINVAEVMANDDKLDGVWDLAGEKAKGSIKLRLK